VHHHQRRDGVCLGAPFSLTPRRVILVDDQVALSARVAGTYTLSCVYQDLHVQGSPFKLTVRAHAACAATSSLVAAPSDTVGGTTATVRVLARDAFGNTTTSGGLSAHGTRSTWGALARSGVWSSRGNISMEGSIGEALMETRRLLG
jgi:hypothetical protein